MTYSFLIGMKVCDGCHRPQGRNDNIIETDWASGYRHYCQQCWLRYRDYYEDENGQRTWKRIGNRYVPNE